GTAIILATSRGSTEYGWGDPLIVALVAAPVLLVAALIAVERRAPEPLLPLRLFRVRTCAQPSAVGLLIGDATCGAINFMTLVLQTVNGVSATDSGLLLIPLMLGMIFSSMLAGQIVTRTDRYRIFPILGCALITAGLFLFSTLDHTASRGQASAYMVV